MLPETLRLFDYGLGHDDRAQSPQPVTPLPGTRSPASRRWIVLVGTGLGPAIRLETEVIDK